MEPIKILTKEESGNLLQRINTLMTQDSDFVKWYLTVLINGISKMKVEENNDLYLPYSGSDVDAVIRLFKGFCMLMFPRFEVNENNIDAIKALAEITTGKKEKKGLVLRGGIGVGKTTLIKIWIKFRQMVIAWKRENELSREYFSTEKPNVVILDPTKLISKFAKEGYSFFEDVTIGNILLIDDLAAVDPISYFGNVVNVMDKLICSIYDKSKLKPDFELYATTDVTSTQLAEIIGQRAASRLAEMAYWKEGLIKGTDLRISNDNPKLLWPNQ